MSMLPYLSLCRRLMTRRRSLNYIPACSRYKEYSQVTLSNVLCNPSFISTDVLYSNLRPAFAVVCSTSAAFSQPKRTYLSQVSHTGFNDYDIGRKEFKLEVPDNFNFANVLDEWARKERVGKRSERIPALWWIESDGNEIKWSYQDIEQYSKKCAILLLKKLGLDVNILANYCRVTNLLFLEKSKETALFDKCRMILTAVDKCKDTLARTANILEQNCGVKQGDNIMVILPRVPEWWLITVACLRTGAVMIPGTTMLTARDILERVVASNSSVIVADDNIAPLVDQVADDCSGLTTKLLVSQSSASRDGWVNFKSLFESASETHICADTRSNDPIQVFFTSGTTGKSKMAEHTHASCGLGHVITGKYWLDLTPHDVLWNMSDTGWAKAAYSNVFAPWNQGACVFVLHNEKFDAKQTLETLAKYHITTFCAPPTAYRMMIQEDLRNYDLKSIRHTLSAGEPLNPVVVDEWKRRTNCSIREGYGQTETTLLVGSFLCIKNKPGSMGRPSPGYDIHIVDDKGKKLGVDQEGIIGVKVTPDRPVGLFTRYVDDPDRTTASFVGEYYLTGDKATMDSDGYLWFIGRGDDVIISAGYRIGPFEVESALIEHPAVAESAVVSSPDDVRGDVVKAFIVLTQDYKAHDKTTLTTEIQDHVKKITAPYKYPRKIEFVESLPKTISGKIRRVELREQEWAQQS